MQIRELMQALGRENPEAHVQCVLPTGEAWEIHGTCGAADDENQEYMLLLVTREED